LAALNPFAAFTYNEKNRARRSQDETVRGKIDRDFYDLLKPGLTTEALLKDYLGTDALVSFSCAGGVETNDYVVQHPDGSRVTLKMAFWLPRLGQKPNQPRGRMGAAISC
jgi:hypothetical protein